MSKIPQVGLGHTTVPSGTLSSGAGTLEKGTKTKDTPIDVERAKRIKEHNDEQRFKARRFNFLLATGATVFALGTAFKDGVTEGFGRIGKVSSDISNMIAVPFSLLFPFVLLKNEHEYLTKGNKGGDESILNRMVYTAASLSFAPVTFSEPLLMATRSKGHLLATLINSPHIVYSFLTYTGGRTLSCIKSLERYFNKDERKKYRLDQEFEALYKLGNLGSAQCSVIPMSGQCMLGLETIKDIFTGNTSEALQRFKHEPISVGLGTLFNSWMFPFEWASKILDTTIRTAEGVDHFKNAFGKDPDNNPIIIFLQKLRDGWHKKSNDKKSSFGRFLHIGREFSKVEALLMPPIGMVSVVTPAFNKFLRGDFFNKGAQDIGGAVGLLDKVYSFGAFFSHIFFTGIYAFSVRLPQTVTTATFYGAKIANWAKGKDVYDPIDIREKIFNRPWINKLTKWAEKRMNKIDQDLHGTDAVKANNEGEKICKHIRTFAQVMAQEVCWDPIKERYYGLEVKDGIKPKDSEWKAKLEQLKADGSFLKAAERELIHYLKTSQQLDDTKIEYFKNGKGKQDWDEILKIVSQKLDSEIENCSLEKTNRGTATQNKPSLINKVEIPKNPWSLLTNPKALFEVAKLRTFHATNSFLPLWVKGFTNVVDYGRRDEDWWYRNFKAQETGIREGDVAQACNREFMTVVAFAFQSMGKGLVTMTNLKRLMFNGEPLPNNSDYNMAA